MVPVATECTLLAILSKRLTQLRIRNPQCRHASLTANLRYPPMFEMSMKRPTPETGCTATIHWICMSD